MPARVPGPLWEGSVGVLVQLGDLAGLGEEQGGSWGSRGTWWAWVRHRGFQAHWLNGLWGVESGQEVCIMR